MKKWMSVLMKHCNMAYSVHRLRPSKRPKEEGHNLNKLIDLRNKLKANKDSKKI